MGIRRIRADEHAGLRELRLRALADTPEAFGRTHAEETAQPPERWTGWAERGAAGDAEALFVLEHDAGLHGLAAAVPYRDEPRTCMLISMWVAPERRRTGAGERLVRTAMDWAASAGYDAMLLWVVQSNVPALALYRKLGFVETGRTQPLPSNPSLPEQLMRRSLP
ncbi:MAG: GNAT family N-acetyltransferase [Chloroflexi bacterium]|nr:GNAT family N-acetyltransferase [Chloroflexota bacterium]